MADFGTSCEGASGGTASSSGGNNFDKTGLQNGVEVCGNDDSAATVIANSSEARNLLAHEEHHLMQRRRHHHNFKKSASSRNLAGTDGMIESDLSSFPLSRPNEHGSGGDAVAVAPVSVSPSVDMYSGGRVRSSSLPGGGCANVPAAALLWDHEAQVEPPLDGAGGSSGSRYPKSRGKRVSFEGDVIINSNNAEGSPCSPKTQKHATSRNRSSSNSPPSDDGGGAGGHAEAGEDGREHFPPTTLSGDCSTTTVSATVTTAAIPAVAVGESAEEEEGSAAVPRTSVGGTPYPADVVVSSVRGNGGSTESSGATTSAGNWYTHSKLSCALDGLSRTAVAAENGSGVHIRAPAAGGAALPRVRRPRQAE